MNLFELTIQQDESWHRICLKNDIAGTKEQFIKLCRSIYLELGYSSDSWENWSDPDIFNQIKDILLDDYGFELLEPEDMISIDMSDFISFDEESTS